MGANIGGGSGVTGVTSPGYGVFGFCSTGNAVFGFSDSGGILPQRHPDPGGRSLVGEEHRDRADADEPGPGHHPGQCGRSLRAGSDPGHRIARVVYHPPEQDRLKERQGCLVRRQLRRPPRGNARSPSLGVMFLDRRAPRSVCLDCFGRPIRCQIPSSAVHACPETTGSGGGHQRACTWGLAAPTLKVEVLVRFQAEFSYRDRWWWHVDNFEWGKHRPYR